MSATPPSSSCHPSSFIRTQSDPPNAIYNTSSSNVDIQAPKCKHCQCVDRYKLRFKTIVKSLVNSCKEVTNAIRSRFQEDACVCYPNVVYESDVIQLERSEYLTIHLSAALRDELLQHVLRIVRPGASEHESNAPNSRLIRHTAASKILIPLRVNRDTEQAVQVGFPTCHGFPPLPQSNSVNLQVIDVIIDYDPPQEIVPPPTTAPLLFRTPTGYTRTPSTPHPLWDTTSQQLSRFQFEGAELTYPQESTSITDLSVPVSPVEEKTSQESSPQNVDDFSLTEPVFPYDCDCVRPLKQLLPNKKLLVVGQYSTRGRRLRMEDKIVIIEDVQKEFSLPPLPNGEKVSFFSVFDGHGGTDVVDFVSKKFPECFVKSSGYAAGDYVKALYEAFELVEKHVVLKLNELIALSYRYEESIEGETDECLESEQGSRRNSKDDITSSKKDSDCDELTAKIQNLRRKLSLLTKQTKMRTPEELKRTDHVENQGELQTPETECSKKSSPKDESTLTSGSTALVVIIVGNQLYVANLGDSRCILSRGDRITCLTEDHRLRSSTRELKRVQQTPGTYSYDGYLCGQLGVSRAFGNIYRSLGKKLLGLSSYPDVINFELQSDDEFLVAGCDGVFDTMAASDVATVVKKVLQTHNDPFLAAKELVELALINHAEDNVSAIVIWLRNEIASNETETNNSRLFSTSSFFFSGSLIQKQRGLSRIAKSTPSIVPQNLTQRLSLLDSSAMPAYCNQCTCKELNHSTPNNTATSSTLPPHPVAKVSSQRPAVRKRYCWNVVHTP